MADVLKLAEEALEMHLLHMKHNHVTYLGFNYDEERKEQTLAREYVTSDRPEQALAAIRSARSECGWRPIAELTTADEFNQSTILGRWGFWCGQSPERWCLGNCGHLGRAEAINSGYTYFCRPQLPPPPAREEVGNA